MGCRVKYFHNRASHSGLPGHLIRCGSNGPGPDHPIIKANKGDIVLARAGNDTINARNNGWNLIDGGRGSDRATVDETGDSVVPHTVEDVERAHRALAMLRQASAGCPLPSPRFGWRGRLFGDGAGCVYDHPASIKCSIDDQSGLPSVEVSAPPLMAAVDANGAYVDWQYVAWRLEITSVDDSVPEQGTPWFWDVTGDLNAIFDTTDTKDDPLKQRPDNVWRLFGRDSDQILSNVANRTVFLPQLGDYRFLLLEHWYPQYYGSGLKPLPSVSLSVPFDPGVSNDPGVKVVGDGTPGASGCTFGSTPPPPSPPPPAPTFGTGDYHVTASTGGGSLSSVWRLAFDGDVSQCTTSSICQLSSSSSSDWTCCPAKRTDLLTGTFDGARLVVHRDCTGQGWVGPCEQTFTGIPGADGKITDGRWCGTTGPPCAADGLPSASNTTTFTLTPSTSFGTGIYLATQGPRTSLWNVTVTAAGDITGTSVWVCCPGPRIDALSGKVTGTQVVVNRDCSGFGFEGPCTQVFTGTVGADGQVRGTWSGTGASPEGGSTFTLTPLF